MNSEIRKGITNILFANVINMCFSLVTSFVLPKFLSVESYAIIKTFQLYTAYAGIFSLGFIDGMYLKYGGIDIDRISKDDVRNNSGTWRLFQVIVVALLIFFALILHDRIILAFAMAVFPLNMINYFRSLCQAIGAFKQYGRIINLSTILTFIANIFLLFVIGIDNGYYFLGSYIFIDVLIFLLVEIYFKKSTGINSFCLRWDNTELIRCIKDGFLLMCGYFTSVVMTSMDRWFVKVLLMTADFAQYSFAVTMENFLNVAVTPVSVTLYNQFCKDSSVAIVTRTRRYVQILAIAIIAAAFPAKFIVEIVLDKYIGSVNVLFLLFSSQIFYIINKSIYVNLYRVKRKQSQYFRKLVIDLFLGAAFNYIFFIVARVKEAFAWGTVLAAFLWFVMCSIDFKEYKYELKDILFLTIQFTFFLVCGMLLNTIIGAMMYVAVTVIDIKLMFNAEYGRIINEFKKYIRKLSIKK